jgi:hypothetical protein
VCLLSPEPVVHCTAALHLSYRKERKGEREGVRGCLRYFMSVTIAKRSNYPLSIPPSPALLPYPGAHSLGRCPRGKRRPHLAHNGLAGMKIRLGQPEGNAIRGGSHLGLGEGGEGGGSEGGRENILFVTRYSIEG